MKKNYEAPLLEIIGFVTESVLEPSEPGEGNTNLIPSGDSGDNNDHSAFSPFGGGF